MFSSIRTLVITAVGSAVVAAGLGAAVVAGAGTAHADNICWDLQYNGTTSYYYC